MTKRTMKRITLLKEALLRVLNEGPLEDRLDVGATASMAHYGQMRRDGSEYITHPREVSNIIDKLYPEDELASLVALLHDTFEDAPGLGTVRDADELKSFIRGSIGDNQEAEDVIEAVERLTHEKGSDYSEYVEGLLDNKLALRVKLADMLHNLSSSPKPKQAIKYKGALAALYDAAGERRPPGVSTLHWKLLAAAATRATRDAEEKRTEMAHLREYISQLIKSELLGRKKNKK